MSGVNRQWLLAKRPQGQLTIDCFEYREVPPPTDALGPNRLLVRNRLLQLAPVMRAWMGPPGGAYPSMLLGQPVLSPTVAEVLASTDARFPTGRLIYVQIEAWQDYAVLDSTNEALRLRLFPDDSTLEECLGVYGTNQLAAYFGIIKVGEVKPGDTLVVSGAAGSTGSWAAQIGKICGARVIGIAGGAAKCQWLLQDCGLAAAIDYKSESVGDRLRELCPNGVDVFFDNVGGHVLQAVVDNIARRGRIAICGQMAGYTSADRRAPGPNDMMQFVYRQAKLQGFAGIGWPDEIPKAEADLRRWVTEGRIVHREDVREGFENIPTDFLSLFEGGNQGSLGSRL